MSGQFLRRGTFLILAFICVVSSTDVDNALRYRQIVVPKGTGSSASAAASSSLASSIRDSASAPETSTPVITISDAPSTVQTSVESSPDVTSTPTSTASEEVASDPTTSLASETPLDSLSTDSDPSSGRVTTSSEFVVAATSLPVVSRTQEVVTTVVTVSGSRTFTNILTTSGLLAVSSTATPSRGAPSVGGNGSDSGSSGLEPSQKRIIIGTVVGIGGAILLGGIAVVAWRIWGKRKHEADGDHDLMDSQPGSSGREKTSSISGNTPFRSTLDQYHNPAGPVNAASNF